MMTISVLMITTNKADRIDMTMRALDSVELKSECEYKEKVLSVDFLSDEPQEIPEQYKIYERLGWKVVGGPCSGYRGMVYNIERGLEHITSELIFHCEDHVEYYRVPGIDAIQNILCDQIDNVRWINYNTHLIEDNLAEKRPKAMAEEVEVLERYIASYINNEKNYKVSGPNCYLLKGKGIADEYMLNFPACLTYTKLFKTMLRYGLTNYEGIGIEIGFSKAWKDLGYQEHYNVAIYLHPEIIDMVISDHIVTPQDVHDNAQMRFRNNDTNMFHDSIQQHDNTPGDKKKMNSFF